MNLKLVSVFIFLIATLSLEFAGVRAQKDLDEADGFDEEVDLVEQSTGEIRSKPELENAVSSLEDSEYIIQIDSLMRAGRSVDHAILRIFVQTVEDERSIRDWFDAKVKRPCEKIMDLFASKRDEIDQLRNADPTFNTSPAGSLDQTCDELLASRQTKMFQ